MNRKRLLSVLVIIGMFFLTFNFNIVAAKEKVGKEDVKFTTIELSDSYSKLKVEYLKTGKVEYVESVLEDGEFVNYVLSSNGEKKHKVEAIKDDIYLDGEVIVETTETVESFETLPPSPAEFSTMATKWEYISTTKGNSSWKVANATIIAAAVATVLQIPAGAALVISIAGTFLSLELTQVWWERYNYLDADRNYNTCRRAHNTNFYQHSNYSGFIRSTGIVAEWIDPCNSGY